MSFFVFDIVISFGERVLRDPRILAITASIGSRCSIGLSTTFFLVLVLVFALGIGFRLALWTWLAVGLLLGYGFRRP